MRNEDGAPELCAPSSCLGGVLSEAAGGFYAFVQAWALCRRSPTTLPGPEPRRVLGTPVRRPSLAVCSPAGGRETAKKTPWPLVISL